MLQKHKMALVFSYLLIVIALLSGFTYGCVCTLYISKSDGATATYHTLNQIINGSKLFLAPPAIIDSVMLQNTTKEK